MSERLNRKDLKHDKFVEEVGTAYSFARQNKRRLLGISGAILLLALSLAGWFAYQSRQESKGQLRLAEGIEVMNAPVSETPAPATVGKSYKTEDEKVLKAEPIFKEVVTKYKGSDAASIADLYLARIAAWRGDIASARPRLERFVASHREHLLAAPAQMSLYEMRIEAGEVKAVTTELEAELKKEESLVPHDSILALLARSYQRLGDRTKAAEMNRRIITEYPDSAYFLDAQRQLPPA
ncbi:MAG TPA: tetratricopeptide repeat protein [Thermoanaerobaculia bacterium]|nr:tetratricopeptide repeat protein [Thermoanaerobaculia bacterium]